MLEETIVLRNYAHIGDSVWELFVRTYTIYKTSNAKVLHKITTERVNATFQKEMLDFIYEDLILSNNEMTKDDSIEVTVTVYNDSNRAGKETVQLYLRDMVGSTARPIQQLIAFEKIELKAGQRKTVKFTITEPMLRFWNDENQFVSEKGEG